MPTVRDDGVRIFGRRQVQPAEKNCLNCMHHDECHQDVTMQYPSNFARMDRWDPADLEPYFKSIFGGICGNYMPVNVNRRERWIQAKQEALLRSGKNEWDF